MASFLNKAKDKIEATLNQNKSGNTGSDNYGSHQDTHNNPTSHVGGQSQTHAYDNYSSNTNNPNYNNPQSSNEGPHKSNLLNKLDPRTDSDRDHRNDPTSHVGGHGNTQQHGAGHTGIAGEYGATPVHNATTHSGHGNTGLTGHTGHTEHAGGLAASTTTGTSGYGGGSNTYDNPQSTTAGPHSSNLLNKADPRVDSDRDHRNDPTSRVGGYGAQGEDFGHTSGTTGGYSTTTSHTTHSTTAGPHSSNLLNKTDPRVDSDGDHRNDPTSRVGGYGAQGENYGHTSGTTGGLTGTTGGYGHTSGTTGDYSTGHNTHSTTSGPHSSNLMNKADPRFDSDRDHRNDPTSRVGGYGDQGENYGHTSGIAGGLTGTTGGYSAGNTGGYGHTSGTTSDYSSGTTGGYGADTTSGGYGGQHTGNTSGYAGNTGGHGHGDNYNTSSSGNTSGTAGPHSSNILNKLDPRVDSDRDGSKTYGGNQTNY